MIDEQEIKMFLVMAWAMSGDEFDRVIWLSTEDFAAKALNVFERDQLN